VSPVCKDFITDAISEREYFLEGEPGDVGAVERVAFEGEAELADVFDGPWVRDCVQLERIFS
jgi:hypothetical protein